MKWTTTTADLKDSLEVVRGFVHRAGADGVPTAMSAVLVSADADEGTLEFVGNNTDQRMRFAVKVDVQQSGRTLIPVASALTVLSAMPQKATKLTVELVDDVLELRAARVSASIPVLDPGRVSLAPKPPIGRERAISEVEVDGSVLAKAVARVMPVMSDSDFPRVLMWGEDSQLNLMGPARAFSAFAAIKTEAQEGPALALMLWQPDALKRVSALAGASQKVSISTVPIHGDRFVAVLHLRGGEREYLVEQALENVDSNFTQARDRLLALWEKTERDGDSTHAKVIVESATLSRVFAAASKVRGIHVSATADPLCMVELTAESGVASVSLVSGHFSEEVDVTLSPPNAEVVSWLSTRHTVDLLSALESSAKVAVALPADESSPRTCFITVHSDDEGIADYWALMPVGKRPDA